MNPSITMILVITFLSLFGLQAAGAREAIPKESTIHTFMSGEFVAITIETPATANPFWSGSSNSTQIVTYSVGSWLPAISLVTALGSEAEQRVTLIPKNFLNNRAPRPTPPEKLPLLIGEEEAGWVQLFVEDEAINTHKAIYRFKKECLAKLGDSFLVIAGDPFARHQTINAEEGGADQPATAPDSKPTDNSTPNPESKPRPQ